MIHWWVNAAFAVHPDFKSHTGRSFSLSKGSVINMSQKQKTNTRSSTETKFVGVDDLITCMQWAHYFIKTQGHMPTTTLHHDNEAAKRLKVNGKRSLIRRA